MGFKTWAKSKLGKLGKTSVKSKADEAAASLERVHISDPLEKAPGAVRNAEPQTVRTEAVPPGSTRGEQNNESTSERNTNTSAGKVLLDILQQVDASAPACPQDYMKYLRKFCRSFTEIKRQLYKSKVVLCTISLQLCTPLAELPPRLRESILFWLHSFSKHQISWIASSMVPQEHLLIFDVILQEEAFQALKEAGIPASIKCLRSSPAGSYFQTYSFNLIADFFGPNKIKVRPREILTSNTIAVDTPGGTPGRGAWNTPGFLRQAAEEPQHTTFSIFSTTKPVSAERLIESMFKIGPKADLRMPTVPEHDNNNIMVCPAGGNSYRVDSVAPSRCILADGKPKTFTITGWFPRVLSVSVRMSNVRLPLTNKSLRTCAKDPSQKPAALIKAQKEPTKPSLDDIQMAEPMARISGDPVFPQGSSSPAHDSSVVVAKGDLQWSMDMDTLYYLELTFTMEVPLFSGPSLLLIELAAGHAPDGESWRVPRSLTPVVAVDDRALQEELSAAMETHMATEAFRNDKAAVTAAEELEVILLDLVANVSTNCFHQRAEEEASNSAARVHTIHQLLVWAVHMNATLTFQRLLGELEEHVRRVKLTDSLNEWESTSPAASRAATRGAPAASNKRMRSRQHFKMPPISLLHRAVLLDSPVFNLLVAAPSCLHDIVGTVSTPGPHSLTPLHFAAAGVNWRLLRALTSTSKGITVFFTAIVGAFSTPSVVLRTGAEPKDAAVVTDMTNRMMLRLWKAVNLSEHLVQKGTGAGLLVVEHNLTQAIREVQAIRRNNRALSAGSGKGLKPPTRPETADSDESMGSSAKAESEHHPAAGVSWSPASITEAPRVDMGLLTDLAVDILTTTLEQYQLKGVAALPLWVAQYFDENGGAGNEAEAEAGAEDNQFSTTWAEAPAPAPAPSAQTTSAAANKKRALYGTV